MGMAILLPYIRNALSSGEKVLTSSPGIKALLGIPGRMLTSTVNVVYVNWRHRLESDNTNNR